jgi:energy-coupling factor transport system permease protein
LDARAKLASAAAMGAAVVLASEPAMLAAVALLLLAGFVAARLPAALLWRGLRGLLWLLVFVAAANAGWAWVARHATWAAGETGLDGPADLALVLLRLLDLLLLAALVTATTVPVDAAEALERLLRPLGRLRLPVHEIGTLLVLSLSFLPILLGEARDLAAAHRSKRGTRRWGVVDRARAVVPLVVPLFLGVLRRADELAVALDARCFEPGAARSSLVSGRLGGAEYAALAAGALVAAGSVALR